MLIYTCSACVKHPSSSHQYARDHVGNTLIATNIGTNILTIFLVAIAFRGKIYSAK